MSVEEKEMTSELLSTAQMKLMQLEAEKEVLALQSQIPDLLRREEKEILEIPSMTAEVKAESSATAMSLLQEGKSPGEVSKALGIPLPLVLEARKVMERSQ